MQGIIRGGLLASALSLACPLLASDTDLAPAEQRWQRLLAGELHQPIERYFDAAGALFADGEMLEEACRDQAPVLAELSEPLDHSISLAWLQLQCADRLGDAPGSEAALSRYATLLEADAARRAADPLTPLRMLVFIDGVVYAADSDQELLYEVLFDDPVSGQLVTALSQRDEEGVERELHYDWLASVTGMATVQTHIFLPPRPGPALMPVLRALAEQGEHESVAQYLQRRELLQGKADKARSAAMRELAEHDPLQGLLLAQSCLNAPAAQCQADAADLLLPALEAGLGRAIALQALILAEGIGMPADPQTAAALLERAGETMAGGTPWLLLDALLRRYPESSLRPLVQQRIKSAALAGSPWAMDRWLWSKRTSEALDEEEAAAVARAAEAGLWAAQRRLALEAAIRGEIATTTTLLTETAAQGDVQAQYMLSRGWELAELDGPADPAKAEIWLRRAAERGHHSAMHRWALRMLESPDSSEAKAGFNLLAVLGVDDAKAAVDFGLALLEGHSMQAPRRKEAIEHLQQVAKHHNVVTAQAHLYLIERFGIGGRPSTRKARRILAQIEKHPEVVEMADGDDTRASALMLVIGALEPLTSRPDRARQQLALMEELTQFDHPLAVNNLAWFLCTSKHAELRDHARGEALVRKALEADPESTPMLDTHAHCLSGLGQHEQAQAQQQQALALASADPERRAGLPGYRARLRALQRAAEESGSDTAQ